MTTMNKKYVQPVMQVMNIRVEKLLMTSGSGTMNARPAGGDDEEDYEW